MIRRTIETLAAGCAVYFLMAACSGSGKNHSADPVAAAGMTSGGHDGQGGDDGQGGVANGAAGESGAGEPGVMNPVAGASAQEGGAPGGGCECEPYVPPEPIVVEAECDIFHDPSNSHWAAIDRPVLPSSVVFSVEVFVEYPTDFGTQFPGSYIPGSYTIQRAYNVLFSDDSIATQCGTTSGTNWVGEKVTFVFRP